MFQKQNKRPKSQSHRFATSNLISQVSALTKQTQFFSEKLAVLTRNSQVKEIPKQNLGEEASCLPLYF